MPAVSLWAPTIRSTQHGPPGGQAPPTQRLIKQQALVEHDRYSCLSIQLSDSKMDPKKRELAERFLEKYLKTSTSIDVYWGDAHTFLAELLDRIESSRRHEGRSA